MCIREKSALHIRRNIHIFVKDLYRPRAQTYNQGIFIEGGSPC